VPPHDVDGFLYATAARDDVFGHDEFLARRDLKAAPQDQAARLFLHEDVAFPQRAADFLADDDAAEGRGDDGVALEAAQFIGEPSANIRRDRGVLQKDRALEELPAMQTGTQNEMAVEQGARLAEERKQVVAHLARCVAGGLAAPVALAREGNRFNFHLRVFRQGRYPDRGARRRILVEIGRVDFIHLLEVSEVGQENGSLDDVREGELLRFEDCRYAVEDASSLLGDVFGHDLAAFWIERDLPGAKDK
jgi:hypothetical protein